MKSVLYIVSSWPDAAGFGGQVRAWHIGRALQQIGKVTVAVVSADAHDAEAQKRTEAEFAVLPPVCPRLHPNRTVIQKLRGALDIHYLNVHGFVAAPEDRARLVATFADYDLVWVLNSRTANILQQWPWPGAHLDIDDVPSTYLRGVSSSGETARIRWKASLQQMLLKRREQQLARRFTTLSVCSEEDRRYLGGGDQIHVIPNGFARPTVEPLRHVAANPPRLGFIGLYSYAPNLDGVRWFLKTCWPAIRRAVPGIRFRLIGKDTDGKLRPADPDVDVLGRVDDPAAEIASWSAMVIPIRFGGGTRIKVADAFSRKCPVVSTSLGAFGYGVEDGRQLRLADTHEAFAAACVEVVGNPASAAAMADRAWSEFLEKWTWDAIAPKVCAVAEDCLRRGRKT